MNVAILLPIRFGASGGLTKYINCICREWLSLDEDISLAIYIPECMDCLSASLKNHIKYFPANDIWHGFKGLSKCVSQGRHDVALIVTARHVNLGSLPIVTMVQNVEPIQKIDYKVSLKWKLRLLLLRNEQKIACRKATKIITTTKYVKQCLISNLGVPTDKIYVLPHGIDQSEIINPGNLPQNAKSLLPGSFFFTAGSLVPYRGLEDIICAYGILAKKYRILPPLVIAGNDNTEYANDMKTLAIKQGVSSCVIWLGQLFREEMSWCYKQCRAFVFATRAEAFCNIALEAMGNGCACIVCDHDPMPEVCADVPIYYKWGNAEALAVCIAHLIDANDVEINKLKHRAVLRSTEYSWSQIAKDTLCVLKNAVDKINL